MALADPTVRSQELGDELRTLRERAGCTLTSAGQRIDASASKICRIENGHITATPEDVAALLVVYNVTGPHRRELLDLAREAEKRGWWQRNRPDFIDRARTLTSLEAKASTLTYFDTVVIPGMMQTRDYARAIMTDCGYVPEDEIEQRTQFRIQRQSILRQRNAPHVIAIVDELALHRPIGGQQVFQQQLVHLAEQASRPNITVLVVPNDGRAHAGVEGPFILLRGAHFRPVIFTENLCSSLFLEDRTEIDQYVHVLECLSGRALDEEQSVELIARLAQRTEKEASGHALDREYALAPQHL